MKCHFEVKMKTSLFVLKDRVPCPVSLDEYEAHEKNQGEGWRQVCRSIMPECEVSTVFLPIDHGMYTGSPLFFETMVFGGEYDLYQERCSTYKQALVMHSRVCEMVRGTK